MAPLERRRDENVSPLGSESDTVSTILASGPLCAAEPSTPAIVFILLDAMGCGQPQGCNPQSALRTPPRPASRTRLSLRRHLALASTRANPNLNAGYLTLIQHAQATPSSSSHVQDK
ncbi:MAG: hypothetical protein WCP45_08900 [Verrucomicrobiota bacterium]